MSTEANDRLVAVEELETLPTLDGTSSPAHESRSCVRVRLVYASCLSSLHLALLRVPQRTRIEQSRRRPVRILTPRRHMRFFYASPICHIKGNDGIVDTFDLHGVTRDRRPASPSKKQAFDRRREAHGRCLSQVSRSQIQCGANENPYTGIS